MGLWISTFFIEYGEETSFADDLQEAVDTLKPEEVPTLERQDAMIGETEFSNYFHAMGEL